MMRNASREYSEDLFADTRMSFGDHLEELRTHLWRAIWGFLVALAISFIPGWYVLEFIAAPVEQEIQRFYDQRVERVAKKLREGNDQFTELNLSKEPQKVDVKVGELATALGVKLPEGTQEDRWVTIDMRVRPLEMAIELSKAQQVVGRRPGLSTLGPMEAFMAYIKVCFVVGFVLGSPWIFYQIWSFVAAGLYPHEKRLVHVYLPVSIILFAAGAVLCQFTVIPKALEALLWFNYWLNLEPDLRFNEWLGFAILLPVIFGLSFQLPMVMLFLERLGIVDLPWFKKNWKLAIFLIHAFAAVATPADVFSMESLALTMCALYGLGMLLCWINPRKRETESEPSDTDELVEV
jgi:sec-independent protein translocase protein TatC